MDNPIEIFREPVRQIKRRTAVHSNGSVNLHDRDLVSTNPVQDVFGEFMYVIVASVPHGSTNNFPRRRRKAENPRDVLLRRAGCAIKDWRWRPVKDCRLLLTCALALRLRQPPEVLTVFTEYPYRL